MQLLLLQAAHAGRLDQGARQQAADNGDRNRGADAQQLVTRLAGRRSAVALWRIGRELEHIK